MSPHFPRRAGKILVALALAVVATLGASVVHAPSASAQSSGPAYFLWSSRTGEYGPCADRVGNYIGEYGIGTTGWDSIYLGHRWVGDHSFYDYRDRGFDTAYVYYGCYGSYPAYGYYGAHKISRGVHVEYYCPADTGSCVYWGTHYDSWRAGW